MTFSAPHDFTVIVCGGRRFHDSGLLGRTLDAVHAKHRITCLIEGGAGGCDALAYGWACGKPISTVRMSANWAKHGPSAGPIRNQDMLRCKPDLVVAFPGGLGTANMMEIARRAGIEVMEVGAE